MHFKSLLLAGALFMAGMLPTFAGTVERAECNKRDVSFHKFLTRFTDDVAFQRSRLLLPLVYRSGDGMAEEETVELWPRTKIEAMTDPLIYSRKGLKKNDLAQTLLLFQPGQYAEVFQANAGDADSTRLMYRFRTWNGCWYLEEFDDLSL